MRELRGRVMERPDQPFLRLATPHGNVLTIATAPIGRSPSVDYFRLRAWTQTDLNRPRIVIGNYTQRHPPVPYIDLAGSNGAASPANSRLLEVRIVKGRLEVINAGRKRALYLPPGTKASQVPLDAERYTLRPGRKVRIEVGGALIIQDRAGGVMHELRWESPIRHRAAMANALRCRAYAPTPQGAQRGKREHIWTDEEYLQLPTVETKKEK